MKYLLIILFYALSSIAFSQEVSFSNFPKNTNCVLLIAEKGKIVFNQAFGLRNSVDSMDINTSFHLASISKPITAIAVFLLQKKGLFDLNDSIKKFLPDFPHPNITLKQMLNHTSGLGYRNEKDWDYLYSTIKDRALNNNDYYEYYLKANKKLLFTPGTKFSYSNDAYDFLAMIVEKVSGEKFTDFIQNNIFIPLKMNNLFGFETAKSINYKNFASSFEYSKGKIKIDVDSIGAYNDIIGSNNICSSAQDLFLLDKALYSEILFSEETIQNIFSNTISKNKETNFGLGWFIDRVNPYKVSHTGEYLKYSNIFVRYLNSQNTVIFLSNSGDLNKFYGSIFKLEKFFAKNNE